MIAKDDTSNFGVNIPRATGKLSMPFTLTYNDPLSMGVFGVIEMFDTTAD